MSFHDDRCLHCREYIDDPSHRWCEVERRFVCNGGCEHEGCGDR